LAALTVAACLGGVARAQAPRAPEHVPVGAIRWDNWRLDSSASAALADPSARDRVPYFAARLADGSLGVAGDSPRVLDADVHYARAAGIDYFIFGYYIETASWGRTPAKAIALNRALEAYLHLPDRQGVKFALSFNFNFPASDVPAAAAVLARMMKTPDYIRTRDGAGVVYFFVPNLGPWMQGFGGEAGAAQAMAQLRQQVKAATGSDIYLVALLFGMPQAAPVAMRVGFDATSVYVNGLGVDGRAVPYGQCAASARQFWQVASSATAGGFLPTFTLGWDFRPAWHDPAQATRPHNPDWCEPATDREWTDQLRAAMAFALADPHNARFPGVVVYAWNEFLEGGWIAPTVTEGTRRLGVFANAMNRHPAIPAFSMAWPARVDPQRCKAPAAPEPLRNGGAACREIDDRMTMDWPCPPGMRVGGDMLRAPSAAEAALNPGVWQQRSCVAK
jgi:hypothetical protein